MGAFIDLTGKTFGRWTVIKGSCQMGVMIRQAYIRNADSIRFGPI